MTLPIVKAPPSRDDLSAEQKLYAVILGMIQHVVRFVRIDLQWACNRLARGSCNPSPEHLSELYRMVEYLRDTADLKLTYGNQDATYFTTEPVVFSDANYVGKGERSTSGVVVMYAGAAVIHRSKRQEIPSTSAAESELYALEAAIKAAVYVRKVATDMDISFENKLWLFGDNKASLAWANSHMTRNTMKHFLEQLRYAQFMVPRIPVELGYVKTADNVADLATKHLEGQTLRKLRDVVLGLFEGDAEFPSLPK